MRSITRLLISVTVAAFMLVPQLPIGSAGPVHDTLNNVDQNECANVPWGPQCDLWTSTYDGPQSSDDYGIATVASTDGRAVYVTGVSWDTGPGNFGDGTRNDYVTIAYNITSGAKLWSADHDGPASLDDVPVAIATHGSLVVVTGTSKNVPGLEDIVTIGYDAATGAQKWIATFDTPWNGSDQAAGMVLSPDGSIAYVTGSSQNVNGRFDIVTLAYDTASGTLLWTKTSSGIFDWAGGIDVSPDGSRVVVTGRTFVSAARRYDVDLLAFNAQTGADLWNTTWGGAPNHNLGLFVKTTPDGTGIIVAGKTTPPLTGGNTFDSVPFDITISRFNSATGTQIWNATFAGSAGGDDQPTRLLVSPDGSRAYIVGWTDGGVLTGRDYLALAYDTATGNRVWQSQYNGPANFPDRAYSGALSPAGDVLYLTGTSPSGPQKGPAAATVALDSSLGVSKWVARYTTLGKGNHGGNDVTVSPDGSRVFVTGWTTGLINEPTGLVLSGAYDVLTLAYASTGPSGAGSAVGQYLPSGS